MNTITPTTIEAIAEILAAAAAEGQPVVPSGAGLHQHLGGPISDTALRLSTLALDSIIEHSPADLIVRVETGVRLADVQRTLGEHGQWLPWDPPAGAAATIGGLLAAARSGPLRLGYGTPRDWLLGATVVLGDGRVIKSGGKVVKNVAGYDSHKLQIGALGTLGVIATATFKVAPVLEQDVAMVGYFPTLAQALVAADQLRERPLSPVSLATLSGSALHILLPDAPDSSVALILRSIGLAASVARHAAAASALGLAEVADARHVWQQVGELATPAEAQGVVLRCGVRPAAIATLLDAITQHAPANATIAGYPGIGLAYTCWEICDDLATRLASIRAAILPHDGYLVVESIPSALRGTLDIWGPPPATLAIMQRLRAQWDPARILNLGRFMLS